MAGDDKPPKPPGFWQTAPGMMTGAAALITALTGLVVALLQTGVFGTRDAAPAKKPDAVAQSKSAGAPAAPGAASTAPAPSAAAAPAQPVGVEFEVPRTVTLGQGDLIRYTFTRVVAEQRDTESLALVVSVRLDNGSRYSANFWDRTFRLRTNDGHIAASGGLNEIVDGKSTSPVREVRFIVPRGAVPSALVVEHGESTALPLRLTGW